MLCPRASSRCTRFRRAALPYESLGRIGAIDCQQSSFFLTLQTVVELARADRGGSLDLTLAPGSRVKLSLSSTLDIISTIRYLLYSNH